MLNKIRYEAFAFVNDNGKFELTSEGTLILGVLLTGDSLPRGEKFFEFATIDDVNTAIDMLTEYNATKTTTGVCGVRAGGNDILVGLCPKDFDDDSYKEFEFTSHDAACEALSLIRDFCKYKFGRDSTNDDWESSLHDT